MTPTAAKPNGSRGRRKLLRACASTTDASTVRGDSGVVRLTGILPGVPALRDAELSYPANCETPIAAKLMLTTLGGAPARAEFDIRHTRTQTWDIEVVTESGTLALSMGASVLELNDRGVDLPVSEAYPSVYAHFAELVSKRAIDVDVAPLQLVAEAFLSGRRVVVETFLD